MHTKIVKFDPAKPDVAKIKEAAALLDAGELVVFPTETVYGIACRVKTDSLIKLNKLKGRTSEKYYTLHIGEKDDVKKYVPSIGLRAQKLIENAWPGPLTIVFELDSQDLAQQRNNFDEEIFENLYRNSSIGIRCPDNSIASLLLKLTNNPVVAPSANIKGQPPATDPEQVLSQLSGQIKLLLDAGPCKHKISSTVVKIGKKNLEILRPGVYSQSDLKALSEVKILFVCTGNTCRSPMAEGIFRKYLAEKLGCGIDYLEEMGYKIYSAGTIGMVGFPASGEAVLSCAAKGIDIRSHISRALTEQLIEESDFIFAMSPMHYEHITALSPKAAKKCELLAKDKSVPDPIGRGQEVYNNCRDLIEKAVKEIIGRLVI